MKKVIQYIILILLFIGVMLGLYRTLDTEGFNNLNSFWDNLTSSSENSEITSEDSSIEDNSSSEEISSDSSISSEDSTIDSSVNISSDSSIDSSEDISSSEDPIIPINLELVGDINDWNLDNDEYVLESTEDENIYTLKFTTFESTEFKIINDNNYDDQYSDSDQLSVDKGVYSLEYDISTNECIIEKIEEITADIIPVKLNTNILRSTLYYNLDGIVRRYNSLGYTNESLILFEGDADDGCKIKANLVWNPNDNTKLYLQTFVYDIDSSASTGWDLAKGTIIGVNYRSFVIDTKSSSYGGGSGAYSKWNFTITSINEDFKDFIYLDYVEYVTKSVTYSIISTSEVEVTGDAPIDSTVSFVNTNTNNKYQLTAGNSATLTLSNFDNCIIKNVTLSMKSNKSSGSGSLYMTVNDSSYLLRYPDSTFDTWYGSYSSEYVDFIPIISDPKVLTSSSVVEVELTATVNSLYIQSYTIEYLIPANNIA